MPRVPLDEFFKNNDPTQGPAPRNVQRLEDGTVRMPVSAFFGMQEIPKAPNTEPAPFKRGLLTVASDFTAAGGLVAGAFGYDEAAQGLYQRAREFADQRDVTPRRINRVEEISSLSDVGIFAYETLVENAPLLASIALPGAAAAKLAGFAGRGAVGRRVTGTLTAFMSDVGLQTGESVQIALDANADPEDLRVVGSGIGKGALDFVPIMALAKRLGLFKGIPFGESLERNIAGELIERGFIRRAVGNVGTLIAYEVPTEVAQETINISLDRSIKEFEGALTPEEKSQLLNAAAGAAAFGLLGIPAAAFRPSPNFQPEQETPDVPEATDTRLLALPAPEVEPDIPQLEGPEGVPQLPAPPIRVGRDGTAVLPADYDPSLEQVKTGTEVARAVAQSVNRNTEAADATPVFLVNEEGVIRPKVPDDLTQMASAIVNIPQQARLPIEQAITVIAEQRHQAVQIDPFVVDTASVTALPKVVESLMQRRDAVIGDAGSRRTSDGQLTARAQLKVEQFNEAIASLSQKLGIKNPLDGVRTYTIEEAETQLPQVNAQEQRINEAPTNINLSPAESAQLEKLEAKDYEEGLTTREEERRAELIAKRQGESRAERSVLSAKEVRDLRKLGAELGDNESMQVRRREEDADKIREEIGAINHDLGRLERGLEPELSGFKNRLSLSDEMTGVDADDIQRAMREMRAEVKRLEQSLQNLNTMSVQEVAGIVAEVTTNMQGAPEFIVAQSNDPRAFGVDDKSKERAAKARGAKGIFFPDQPNRVYIFADKHSSAEDVQRTVLHETLAHFGLRAYFTPEELSSVLDGLYVSRGEEIQKKFGIPENEVQARNFAEEYIAEIAETGTDMTILQRVIAQLRRALRKIWPKFKISDNDLRFMLRDVGAFLNRGILPQNSRQVTESMSSEPFMRAAGQENVEEVLPQIDSFMSVWRAKAAGMFFSPLQMAERFNIPGAKAYIETVQQWEARRGELTKEAADIADVWQKLPKREAQRLSKVIFEISERSDELGRRLSEQEKVQIYQANNVSTFVRELYTRIEESFKVTLNQLQAGLERAAIRNAVKDFSDPSTEAKKLHELWTKDKTQAGRSEFFKAVTASPALQHFELGSRLINIENDMNQLRNRNYFPRMRFGRYAIVIRAQKDLNFEGKEFKSGEVVTYETFETFAARKSRMQEIEKQFNKNQFRIQQNLVTDEEFSFIGMPPALFEELNKTLNLSDGQKEMLKELYFKYSPGRAFLRHLTKRKGIKGYSVDAMRVYASYMMNAANHIARVEYHEDMGRQVNTMREASKTAEQGTRYGIVHDYFSKHFTYLMNPEEDFAKYRALGFLWYLGFNVKSAMVNLTQIPMVAYPFLAHHYGDATATAALARAYKNVSANLLGKKVFDTATDEALARGIRERFLDESFATELAGIGESDVLQRLLPEDANVRALNTVSYYGSFLFKHAEKYNREVVFIAARELALKRNPNDQEAAFLAARKAVQTTMFEYSKWNRPTFMRGKKSVIFLFWQYMQHLGFLAYGGEGKGVATRVWLMLLFAAGLQGLPFAENIFDIVDFGGTQIREALGVADPRLALRQDIRDLAAEITNRPDLVMHGLSRHYGLGPLHLMAGFGAPIPQVDVSGSIGAGRVIPGTESVFGNERNPDAQFGRTMAEVLGPVVGIGYNLWKSLESDDPDTWKVWERAMPSALQAASKAARRGQRGEESFRGGGAVAEFDPHNTEHLAENISQAFGFATTRVNQRFELRQSQENLKRYWVTRRSVVMENFAYALLSEDQEAIADARKALLQFNRQAPAPALRIGVDKLQQSIRERFRRGALREAGIPNEKAFLPLYMKLEESFPEGASAIPR